MIMVMQMFDNNHLNFLYLEEGMAHYVTDDEYLGNVCSANLPVLVIQ